MPVFDITDRVVHDLGPSVEAMASGAPQSDALRWDCSIAGLKFLFATGEGREFQRQTASFRRDRVDTERNPGEQSLDSGYWLRSQASWHYGSGLASAEPLEVSEDEARFRYAGGGGVDPWTPGEMSLLKDTASMLTSTGSNQQLLGVNTGVLHADGTTLTYVASGGSTTAVTWGGSGTAINSLTTDGANYYAANDTGIYKGALPSSAGSLVWNTGSTTVCRWVKGRLFASVGLALYELTSGGPALPTALYTHPTTGWTWTDFSEGPTAIYASGYSGDQSFIYRITVNTTTTTVTLDQPTVVADMPRGEVVYSLYSYVGAYMVLGTNKGTRVASINADGSLTLGPLVVESSDGCKDAVADGSFVYVTVGAKGEAGNRAQRGGLYRIDLGTNLNNSTLQFAHAADLVCPAGIAGSCDQVTTAGGRLWFTVTGTGGGVFRETATYVSEGWLETGRIRLGTVESKAWRTLRLLQKEDTLGSVWGYASVSDATGPSTWTKIVEMPANVYDTSGSLTPVAPVALPSIYVAVRLVRDGSSTTPTLTGWQVKAVPAPKRSELVQVPLMLFDTEKDRTGVKHGQPGSAWERFLALKDLESSAATVQWIDYTTGEAAEGFVEQVTLMRKTAPSGKYDNASGVLTVTLRLV